MVVVLIDVVLTDVVLTDVVLTDVVLSGAVQVSCSLRTSFLPAILVGKVGSGAVGGAEVDEIGGDRGGRDSSPGWFEKLAQGASRLYTGSEMKIPTFEELPIRKDLPEDCSWGVFGDNDPLGCLNFLTAEGVVEAAGLVKIGQGISIGRADGIRQAAVVRSRGGRT